MKTAASENSKLIYTTDFKTPAIVGVATWFFLIGGTFGYMWIQGYDVVKEWQANKEVAVGLTAAIILLTILLSVANWQRVEIDELKGKMKVRSFLDQILSKTREFKLTEIETMKTQHKPRRGNILYLQLKDGTIHKINITNLKKGRTLEKYLNANL